MDVIYTFLKSILPSIRSRGRRIKKHKTQLYKKTQLQIIFRFLKSSQKVQFNFTKNNLI